MAGSRGEKSERIRELLTSEGGPVGENTRGFNEGRYESVGEFAGYEELREQARAIQEAAVEDLPQLVDRLTEAVEDNGGRVYLAEDAADATRYVREVVEDRDAETVVKSKSMTTEEVELNEALEAAGTDVWETDLGEFVLQVAEEAPSHLVAPAIHRSRADIARLFNARFDPDDPLETAEELTEFAREYLGERIREADVGVTGANFLTADTGTMALVTSEGNARKTAVTPDTHVAVAGVEKILPSFGDLRPFVELIGRSATGQDLTSYVSLFTPPVESPPIDFDDPDTPTTEDPADREFHLVLVDNGRMAMREDEDLRETLYCIRCGACANSCANFQSVGGHAFGGETYTGGIAGGWEAGVHGLDAAAEFNDLCTGCSRCVPACPVKIDIPWINTVVRDRINREGEASKLDFLVEGLTPDAEPGGLDLQKRLFGNFGTMAKLGSAFAPVSNWIGRSTPARMALQRFFGVDPRRDLPTFRRTTLRDWFRDRDADPPADPVRTAVLYPDPYTNYVLVDRGKAAVRTLEALGVAVRVPAVPASGRAPLSQGMIGTARETAEGTAAALEGEIEAGNDVVVIEPSDLAMFREDYRKLLAEERFETVADRSYELLEYVYGLLETGEASVEDLPAPDPGDAGIAYHAHCQQRSLGLGAHTVEVLEDVGYDVLTTDVECCGMAGSFGYKSEYYELSVDVGERLHDQLTDPAAEDRRTVASGTSCVEQIGDLSGDQPPHPVELLDPAGSPTPED